MKAPEAIKALECRYGDHITFSEVKDGPTWGVRHRRVDFIAISKSWSNLCTKIFEVKVSRSDFLNDKKWPEYLELGNEFYWVCPKGMIKRKEVDSRCGLIYVYETGTCRTVKKALFQDRDPDPYLLLYILMWRHGTKEAKSSREDRMKHIKKEIADRDELGKLYSFFVSDRLAGANREIRIKRDDLAQLEHSLKSILGWLEKKGMAASQAVAMLEKTEDVMDLIEEVNKHHVYSVKEILTKARLLHLGWGTKRNIDDTIILLESIRGAIVGASG